MKLKAVKSFAIALAFLGAAFFVGCSNGSGLPPIPADQHSAYGMTQTQTEAASSQPITVNAATKKLVLSGVKGKTIYMTKTNPLSVALKKENTRAAKIKNGISASIFEDPLEPSGFSREAEQDPHALIYENFWSSLKDLINFEKL